MSGIPKGKRNAYAFANTVLVTQRAPTHSCQFTKSPRAKWRMQIKLSHNCLAENVWWIYVCACVHACRVDNLVTEGPATCRHQLGCHLLLMCQQQVNQQGLCRQVSQRQGQHTKILCNKSLHIKDKLFTHGIRTLSTHITSQCDFTNKM